MKNLMLVSMVALSMTMFGCSTVAKYNTEDNRNKIEELIKKYNTPENKEKLADAIEKLMKKDKDED